jgi:nucleoside phosphorylase
MEKKQLKPENYTVGWVCALPKELTAASAMFDEEHEDLPLPSTDYNTYYLGRIGVHNVVIAGLPKGEIGNNSAATVATRMVSTFKSIRFGLLVGIGGGVPSKMHDIRLGDVVVSTPVGQHGGVIQWDFGKTTKGAKFERAGILNRPPAVLMTALGKLEAIHNRQGSKMEDYLTEMAGKYPKLANKYATRPSTVDVLFESDYDHVNDDANCDSCDLEHAIKRDTRDENLLVHYGLIASGNQVMKHGASRDEISNSLGGALCFEMEAAGLLNSFPCIVVRGICDYADSHKNKQWQEYAAATAAAFAKELLSVVVASQVMITRTADEALNEPGMSSAGVVT